MGVIGLNPREAVRVVDDSQWRGEGICVMLICKYYKLAPMLWPRERLLSTSIFPPCYFLFPWVREQQRGGGQRENQTIPPSPVAFPVFIQEVREHIFPLRILPDPSVDPQQR